MKKYLLFICLLVALSACQSATGTIAPSPASTEAIPTTIQTPLPPSPTLAAVSKTATQASDLVGIWIITSHPDWAKLYWKINPDGTYAYSPNPDGSDPTETGKFWFDNSQFNIQDDFYLCDAPGKYKVQITTGPDGQNELVFTPIDDQCTVRVGILTDAPATWSQAILPLPSP